MNDLIRILVKLFRLVVLVIISFLATPGVAGADYCTSHPRQTSQPGPMATIRLDPQVDQRYVPPPQNYLLRDSSLTVTNSATIVVNYNGPDWTTESRTAFAYAAGIWESLITSTIPIEVDATFSPLPSGVLGGAGAMEIYMNFEHAPRADTWYPVATANKLAGTDLNPYEADIIATFSSTYSNWYFGTGETTPNDKINFASVVLHELGHGLGFFGSMQVDDGSNGIECNGIAGVGCYGYENPSDMQTYPMIYDMSAENGAGFTLLSFPNNSISLGSALTSNDIYFDSLGAIAANGGSRIPLYTPVVWQPGSSYSHLAESYNPTDHALMTYSIALGETIYSPGSVALCMFSDMGWTVTETCSNTPITITGLTAVNDGPTELGSETQLIATIESGRDVDYEWDLGDGNSGNGAVINYEYTATGTYTATITATNMVSSDTAITLVEIVPNTIAITGLIADNDSPTTLGETTHLTATVTSGSQMHYNWDFGDGASGTGALVTHVYQATGIYTATVSAENTASQAVATTTVEILLPSPRLYLPFVAKR